MRKAIIGLVLLLLPNISTFGQVSDFEKIFNNKHLKQIEGNSLIEINFIDEAKGKTIILCSLVKGCKWILEEMAYYNKLKNDYSGEFDVVIISSDDIVTMSKYIQDVNFDFKYINDPELIVPQMLFPEDSIFSVLFDSNGNIIEKTKSGKINRDIIIKQLNKNQTKAAVKLSSNLPLVNFQIKRYELGDEVTSSSSSVNIPTKIMTGYKSNEFIDTIEYIKFCTLTGENILGLYSYAYNLPQSRFKYDNKIEYINSHAPNHRYNLSFSVSSLHGDFSKLLIQQIDLNFGLKSSFTTKKVESIILSQIDLGKGNIKIANSTVVSNILDKAISEKQFHLNTDNINALELSKLIEEKLNVPVEPGFNSTLNYSIEISIESSDSTIDNWIKLFSENGLILKKEIKEIKYITIKNGSD